jgi:hypothetical protein
LDITTMQIEALCRRFREEVSCRRDLLPSLESFPRGACGDTSLLLAEHLKRNGESGFCYVSGDRAGKSHAWLQRGALIVDVTADQFPDAPNAIIVSTDPAWHQTFAIQEIWIADLTRWDKGTQARLGNALEQIEERLT